MSRRAFFQKTGAVVTALGLTELAIALGIPPQAKAYGQALAQSAGRKLALLIGIDNYPAEALSLDPSARQLGKLAGCVTDVALQRELLIHRFGFLPEDIVCLTNGQATRTGIYQAFVDHLYNQATAGDVVVFHFSGYGAEVRFEDSPEGETVRSLVPIDGLLPTETRPALNDISEAELKSLLQQLKTKRITTVLDAGFVDMPVPLSGGLRSRARSAIATGQLPAPFPLLEKARPAKKSAFPGVLLRGADLDNVVLERQWNGFNAGAFTYVLSQYLWSAPAPVTVGQTLGRSHETLVRWGGSNQQPNVSGNRNPALQKSSESTAPVYDTPILEGTRGEGVIKSVNSDGKSVTLWLGGLPPRVLEYLSPASVLTCADRRLRLRSREGLIGKANLIYSPQATPVQPGDPVFEDVRTLPKSIDLVVALDSRLERIERVDATSALSSLAFVSSTSDTELPADCLLGKPLARSPETLTASLHPAKPNQQQRRAASLSPEGIVSDRAATVAQIVSDEPAAPPEPRGSSGYGLFSLTRSLIPGTLALQDEAIKPAVTRLTPKLQALLALKMLRLSENRAASRLPIRVTLETADPQEVVLSHQTLRSVQPMRQRSNPLSKDGFAPEVPVGSRVRYRLFNDSEEPLYYTLINVDPRERLSAFCPVRDLSAPSPEAERTVEIAGIAATTIAPGSSVAIPSAELDWAVEAPPGPVETYVVCSTLPLTRTFNTLLIASANSGSQRISPLPDPLKMVEALLTDISQNSSDDVYTLDASKWATLNFAYQAV